MIHADIKIPKTPYKYSCIICMLNTCNKKDYERHLSTVKHKKACKEAVSDKIRTVEDIKFPKIPDVKFSCGCGKSYKYKRGLWSHQKTCNYQYPECVEIQKSPETPGEVVALLMEQNKILIEQNKQQVEQNKQQVEEHNKHTELLTNTIKDMIPKMGSNNTTNNTNNQFNINMFLNEECKDAINMSDFIKSIQVSLDQLQYTTNNGLDKGITKVIMDNMNKLSKYERPLHCSDLKRETIYIKDNNKWEKDINKERLKRAINKTSNKNYTALTEWTKENPTFMKRDDQQNFYARSMSVVGKPIDGVENKIIKNICKDNQVKE
tara:strand:- start:564 stop:1526 length:963 start_codon:yes stop_codon:yes gene_type:complete